MQVLGETALTVGKGICHELDCKSSKWFAISLNDKLIQPVKLYKI